jgi:predicted RNA binding protein YcfA (HicA-like mRNA interferase family)
MKSISGRAFAKLLEQRGWELIRVQGSHHMIRIVGFGG